MVLLAGTAGAQAPARPHDELGKITVDTSPALFATLTVLDQCGALETTPEDDALRAQLRADVARNVKADTDARQVLDQMCTFVREHHQASPSQDLAQYVSLALNVSGPPFALKRKEADLPPDASQVLGLLSGLEQFYATAHLDSIWQKAAPQYEQRLQALHEPLSKMLFATDLYLKLPFSSYLGRVFVVYVDPQLPPALVNARNYGDDYYVAISPARSETHLDEVRHAYLHYVLDPLILKRANRIKPLQALLPAVANASMPTNYKHDASLLTTESLIRAVEARNLNDKNLDAKQLQAKREANVQQSMEQGFVLTQYFSDALQQFEREPTGIRDAIADLLYQIDVGREKKRAAEVRFSSTAAPADTLNAAAANGSMLDDAEERLAHGDVAKAKEIAQQVLTEKPAGEDPSRALFVLARAAVLDREIDHAQDLFARALESSKDRRVIAWSHISLARIFELRCVREEAMSHYRAAISAAGNDEQAKSVAEKALTAPLPARCNDQKGGAQ
jgi:tetratricopeptide (TPR) repeat protein